LLQSITSGALAETKKNLARGAKYTLSRPALYPLTHDENDLIKLADGELASGTMWMAHKTVGWHANAFPIGIEIDLSGDHDVGSICLRSARRKKADVSFPRRVDLFVSSDQKTYLWGGRMQPLAEAGDGDYLARDFCSKDESLSGRFVRLEVATQGEYFFSD
jgi:hypothetical protein